MASGYLCLVLAVVAVAIAPGMAIKAKFERFEQFLGQEYIDFGLRVRKFNRTEMTLNGTIEVKQTLDDTFVFTSDVFHSRLGNQQFQHYPMHLPTSGLCAFVDHLHLEYATVAMEIVNLPESTECPMTEREMYVLDQVFPIDVLPDSLANGLWKMVITGTKDEAVLIRFMISMRLSDDFLGV